MSNPIIQLNEEVVKNELKELVRKSVEETLNELLDKEADELTGAAKYERTENRQGYRSGHYSRKLTTTSGEVNLNVPKLKGVAFETAIIERYRRRESSVEEALIEMYFAGVSVRRVEDISKALWGSRVSASTISDMKMGVRFREKLGYMPQHPGMYPNFTVERFMWYMAALKDVGQGLGRREKKKFIKEQIASILAAVELDDVPRRRIGALSDGMKQRLCLAQAVLGDPEILILDEPTAGLDPKQRIAIRNYISRIAFNKIVIIATHVVSDIEYIAREIIMLKKGVIVDNAPPHELIKKIEGKVWTLPSSESEVSEMQRKYRVTSIVKSDSGVSLRVLSDGMPTENSVAAAPTLEDYYLYVFGEEATVPIT